MTAATLFESTDGTVVLLDLPRSIEDAQQHPAAVTLPEAPSLVTNSCRDGTSWTRRLISSPPPETPFVTPEPKNGPSPLPAAAQVAQLMIQASVTGALEELRTNYSGPYLLPRQLSPQRMIADGGKAVDDYKSPHACDLESCSTTAEDATKGRYYFPPESHHVLGTIQETKTLLLQSAPNFNVIVLDPPWPNRSAKRKKGGYKVATTTDDIRALLSDVPIPSLLARDGLVAIWVTNKPAFSDMLTSPRDGILSEWGLELVGEWSWLKITTSAEPILPIDSAHRKPWEPLLIAQRKGSKRVFPPFWRRRVIVSVPDTHSRKPNIRDLVSPMLPPRSRGLEIFARNLTAGWWAWGDDVLHFQERSNWVMAESKSPATGC
ncbi:hypothetical protein MCOR27_008644 [Pyricularia oryzae]|uniref:MT-A70-domain-containing protein n=2 Tax=Pyricularia TaxID=48558 RepID=A0ABQ8NIA1_PYRGI|nr:hypothetical protein MCOR01_010329 [Pyricularia oryzae]KAI6297549.1 hypothetical protein MCOR33_006135 [Pyricularia grisea]KAH9438715.1 hypothetical protein MCOR02_002319 [Pyricularia oryzae]KAI6253200.1 hypothetical protein MCOR19_010229 [Pyricularia oryzae]KAI6267149.1 hypothetical protein MCOR26_009846 [Pyricularia oryzae]